MTTEEELKEKLARNWIDEVHDACKSIYEASYQLEELSRALYRVGNVSVSNELIDLIVVLRAAPKAITTSIGLMLSDQTEKGRKEIALVTQVALGIPVEELKKEDREIAIEVKK